MAPAASTLERLATVEARTENNERAMRTLDERLDRLQFWILATFGGMVVSIFLLALSLLTKGQVKP